MPAGSRYKIGGKLLTCPHCGGEGFGHYAPSINRIDMDMWSVLTDSTGRCLDLYRCVSCGFLRWFLDPQGVRELTGDEPCLNCGGTIPEEADACPACAWTWQK